MLNLLKLLEKKKGKIWQTLRFERIRQRTSSKTKRPRKSYSRTIICNTATIKNKLNKFSEKPVILYLRSYSFPEEFFYRKIPRLVLSLQFLSIMKLSF